MSAFPRSVMVALVLMGTAACSDGDTTPDTSPVPTAHAIAVSHDQVLEARVVAKPGLTRLAADVMPPTNRWYSSLAFGQGGLPVYPRPLSVTPQPGGFSVGLPVPVASANAIIGAARADVVVSIDGATDLGTVTHADSVAVSLAMGPATVTMAQGWPAVGISADAALTADLGAPFASMADGVFVASLSGQEFGVVVTDGGVDGSVLTLEAGGSAALFAVPQGTDAVDFGSALGSRSPVVSVDWAVDSDKASTTVTYGETPTVVVMPLARAASTGLECDLGTFTTIDGPYAACTGSSMTWEVPLIEPSAHLSLDAITDDHKADIVAAVTAEAAKTPADLPGDSYFGPKAMFRLANLVQVADAVGETASADQFAAQLAAELRLWADPAGCSSRDNKCLVYDPDMRGVVGLAPSFGSQDFNDHHFHYGYLLYAAAVAGARDPALLADIGPSFDLVADDFAAPATTADFPEWRAFDPVAGHSWASGYAPFADGNNQESSSEAVAAYNGVALWRDLRGEQASADAATWLLSAEAEAARRIYLEPDLAEFDAFDHGVIGIEWSSKRDFATWFSAEPNAVVGIQLIPSPPAARAYYSQVDPERVTEALDAARGEGAGTQFSDYLLMYSATTSPDAAAEAWTQALALPDSSIDDGNSLAYLLAWIAALSG